MKNLIFLAILLILVAGGFWYISRSPAPKLDHISVGTGSATSSNPADVFASLLSSLADVDFQKDPKKYDHTIFDDQVFRTGLVSFRRDLPTIDQSRDNPFAPLDSNPAAYVHYPAGGAPILPDTTLTSFPGAASSTATTTGKGTTTVKKKK